MSIYRSNKHELLFSCFKTMHFVSNFKIIDFEILKTMNINFEFLKYDEFKFWIFKNNEFEFKF